MSDPNVKQPVAGKSLPWPWLIMALIVIGGGLYWRHHHAAAAPAGHAAFNPAGRPQPVQAQKAVRGDLAVWIDALGTVTAANTAVVKSRVDGQLLQLAFREGQMVKKGDLLAVLDPRPFQVQVTQSEGQLARDQAQLANARRDLARYQTLQAQDSIARQQVDTQAALVRQLEGTVQADQGQLDSARLQLTYSRITAPISGRLGLKQVDLGNIVHASDSNGIVVITQTSPIDVIFPIPETQLDAALHPLHAGQRVPVDVYDRDLKTRLASGHLLTVDNQIDTTTGTIKLKAEFNNSDGALFPNQFVNVRMLAHTLKGVTLVPVAAVQTGNQGSYAFVVRNGKVEMRTVQIGPSDHGMLAVLAGIQPGEQVVTDGLDKLKDGAKVQVVDPKIAAPAHKPAGSPPRPAH